MNALNDKPHRGCAASTKAQHFAWAMLVIGLLGITDGLFSQKAFADEGWFLLEFADSKPPCLAVTENGRCIGTRPKTAVFEMRDGERMEMPSGTALPPVWAAFAELWVYAPAISAADDRRTIELTATPMGARLVIQDGEYEYLQSIPLSRWTALEARNQPKLWVRVTPAS